MKKGELGPFSLTSSKQVIDTKGCKLYKMEPIYPKSELVLLIKCIQAIWAETKQ